jgi:hypothetical protein
MVEVIMTLCALVHIATKHLEVQNCSMKYIRTVQWYREEENYIATENAGYHCMQCFIVPSLGLYS